MMICKKKILSAMVLMGTASTLITLPEASAQFFTSEN